MVKNDRKPTIFQKLRRWWRETIGELRKVTWPTWKEALSLTRIVLIVTVVMAVLLGVLDYAFSKLVGLLVG